MYIYIALPTASIFGADAILGPAVAEGEAAGAGEGRNGTFIYVYVYMCLGKPLNRDR